ncbi:hypothetical protein WICPIJ_003812 [Wickerhamomyces pijperi]|uniref:Uncharacterized protein n=1 Tax=Wickerhamomyces pijperi TaxID=599730 RepID=A0A9P8TMN9_WICPI|nr:hypothetical protein WICPIJ_003812 [Wickerhamomyces pijperi]
MSTVAEIVDKANPFHSSPLTNFKNLSTTLTHVYDHYPIVKETTEALLQLSFINYIATFTANLYLDFKTSILNKYFTFINDLVYFFDNYINKWVFINGVDYWLPALSKLHLAHFYPSNQWSNFQTLSYKVVKYLESVFNPVVAPVMKYVNGGFEYAIDNYLPKNTEATVVTSNNANGVLEPASETQVIDATESKVTEEEEEVAKGVKKFVELTNEAIERVQPLVQKKITTIKSVPKDIQTQVSKSSNGLAKKIGLKKSSDKTGTPEASTEEGATANADTATAATSTAVTTAPNVEVSA